MTPSTSDAISLRSTPLPSGESRSSTSTSPPAELSDQELLAATRRLVGRSNQLFASLLAHLAEVEARGIHRIRACASLYTYCIYELRFSEDEAFRRVTAARLVRRFPALLEAVAAGELHLTGLLMLGPHLTTTNLTEVLALAKHRTKKEILQLVRQLDPLPEVPPRIESLGPAPARLVPPATGSNRFASALNPVRELEPGERPRDWMDPTDAPLTESAQPTQSETAPANDDTDADGCARATPEIPAPARVAPQRYGVQFEANDEYVALVERAKALLSHAAPDVDLAELHLRAMRALVAELERQKYAVRAPRTEGEPRPQREPEDPRQRGRYVPAAIRRAVFERDGGRCTFRSDTGERCHETAQLELHHKQPFARGGNHCVENITLHCRAHNALVAGADFGKTHVTNARDASPHESWAANELAELERER